MGTAFIIIGLILTAVLSYVAYWDKPEKDKSGGVSKAQDLTAKDEAGKDEYPKMEA